MRKCGSQKYVEQSYSGHLKVLETNFFVNSWPDTIHMFAIIKNTNALSTLRFGGIRLLVFIKFEKYLQYNRFKAIKL